MFSYNIEMLSRTHDATHVYYNVRIQNGSPDGKNIQCSYRETRNVPIIDDPSQYYLTCVRFSLPTSTVPLLVVPVQPYPNTDPTKTIYSVTLSYGGKTAQQYVSWTPNEKVYSTPVAPVVALSSSAPFTNANDSYYYCRSYVHMMNLVNTALQAAYAALANQIALPVGASAPYLTYDAATKLFSINAPKAAYDVTNANYIALYFNNDLYTLFGALNSVVVNNNNENEDDRQILLRDQKNNTDAAGMIKFAQEFSTLACWSGFKSLVITTGTIPIVSEGIPTAQDYYSNTNVNANGQPTFLNIVSDYDALFDDIGGADFVNAFQYTAQSEYRLIDMIGTQPLTTFDIQCWWQDGFGGLHPLLIAPNESGTLKFLFRKKAFSN
jgi:hypothetical protein